MQVAEETGEFEGEVVPFGVDETVDFFGVGLLAPEYEACCGVDPGHHFFVVECPGVLTEFYCVAISGWREVLDVDGATLAEIQVENVRGVTQPPDMSTPLHRVVPSVKLLPHQIVWETTVVLFRSLITEQNLRLGRTIDAMDVQCRQRKTPRRTIFQILQQLLSVSGIRDHASDTIDLVDAVE